MNLFVSKPHFVLQISQPSGFAQQWLYIHDLYMDLSFQKKITVGKSISQLLIYVTNNQIKKLYIFYGTPFSSYVISRSKYCFICESYGIIWSMSNSIDLSPYRAFICFGSTKILVNKIFLAINSLKKSVVTMVE